MHDLARYIATRCDERLTLKELAREAHLSPSHLQRCFKEVIGVSPHEYQESCRLEKLKAGLRIPGVSVTDAIYNAGFGSPSRVYERIDTRLGMTPGDYQAGGRGLAISYGVDACPLGTVVIGATDRGVCFLQFGDSRAELVQALEREFPLAKFEAMKSACRHEFARWMTALDAYLDGRSAKLDLPLDIHGTAFQIKVWKYLQSIPPGEVMPYAGVAQAIGHPRSIRAVAGACARNRIAIAIPCHRVIRGNGELAGYRWGLERKRKLLALEASGDKGLRDKE